MKGIIDGIRNNRYGESIGFIIGEDGFTYYFDSRDLTDGLTMNTVKRDDEVEFTPGPAKQNGNKPIATSVSVIVKKEDTCIDNGSCENTDPHLSFSGDTSDESKIQPVSTSGIIKYYAPGFPKGMDLVSEEKNHLEPQSGEIEVIKRLSQILRISYINHHDMGHGSIFPFCIVGTTEFLKQFIRGQYEFLMVFSFFRNGDWQQNTLKVVPSIRRRKAIADRRPLVNFYVLVSNARNLQHEINRMKGGTEAAIIPFSFAEILSTDKVSLRTLFLQRFAEYYFENNMLGEEKPIEEDTLLFGDRGKIADSIVQRCIDKSSSGIFGLRRSGKSSVLQAVLRRLQYHEIKYVKIEARSELETIDSWKTALFDIARKVRQKTLGIEQEEEETKSKFYERLNLNSTEEEYQRRATQCFVEDVKRYTAKEQVFVIAVDEIELVTYNTASSKMWQDLESYKGFWGALRDCGCPLIVCGVNSTINEKSTILFNGKICDNPMYQRIHLCADFSKTYLPAFTDEQTKEMINTLGSYSNVAFDNVYVEINRAFGGQPYAIRQFCAYMFDEIKQNRKVGEEYQFSKPTFEALIYDFCNSEKGIQLFNTILQHVTIYSEEYAMLKRIAHAPLEHNRIEPKDASYVDHLEKYGLIEYDRSTNFIAFRIHSIQDYIVKTSTKNPDDMNNDERRVYVQEKVALCERKLKSYIMNYYQWQTSAIQHQGRTAITQIVKINPKANPAPDPQTCSFEDLFDHNKFNMYFSDLRRIISQNWRQLGDRINNHGIDKNRFNIYMSDLNAGRTDAAHYDPEDMASPLDKWEISKETLDKFIVAYNEFERLFTALRL